MKIAELHRKYGACILTSPRNYSQCLYEWSYSPDQASCISSCSLYVVPGDVVRIAPSELSFATPDAYKDIYTQTGSATFIKSKFYKVSNFTASDIIGESDISVHAHMRKLWAHGFSARALISHEELEQRYVNLFIEQIRRHGVASKDGMNMVEW